MSFDRQHFDDLGLTRFLPENYTGTKEQKEFFHELLLKVDKVSKIRQVGLERLLDDIVCKKFVFPREFAEDPMLNFIYPGYKVDRPGNENNLRQWRENMKKLKGKILSRSILIAKISVSNIHHT